MEGHELSLQSIVGFVLVWLMQKAKASNLPMFSWISGSTAFVCRAVSALLALLVSGGVTYAVTNLGDNGYDIVIHTPQLAALAHFVTGAAWQMISQEVTYQSLFNKPAKS